MKLGSTIFIVIIAEIMGFFYNSSIEHKINKSDRLYYSQQVDEKMECNYCHNSGARICKYDNAYTKECENCHKSRHGHLTDSEKNKNLVFSIVGGFVVALICNSASKKEYSTGYTGNRIKLYCYR